MAATYETSFVPTAISWIADVVPVDATQAVDAGSGANRVLTVGFCWGDGNNRDLTAVTYNGVAMTALAAKTTINNFSMQLWRLANPASGSNNVVATMAASAGGTGGLIGAHVVHSADTGGTPVDGYAANSGSASTPNIVSSVTVTSATDDRVVVWYASNNGTENIASTPTNYTEQQEANTGAGMTMALGDAAGAASVATQATWNNGSYQVDWIAEGFNVNASGGGGNDAYLVIRKA